LTIQASGTESLWDEILPAEVKALPGDLARLDELPSAPALLAPIGARWDRLLAETGASSGRGRPTIAMESYVRLMIVKHRSGWGYETLMREVSDSLHLRRFCRIGMTERVPDESTVRKLTRRLGAEVVHEITRELIQKARREKRFRPRAARIDSTVVEADVRWPTDSGLAGDGVKALATEGRKLAARVAEKRTAVRDRSRAMGRKLRALTRTIRRRSGEAKREVLELTGQTGQLLQASIKEARALAATARRRARGRGAHAKLKAAKTLEELADRCEKVCSQTRQRVAGEPIKDRLISLWDPDARPIRKGKLGRVRLRRSAMRDHGEHQARRTRVHPAAEDQAREPGREHAAPRHRDRTEEPRHHAQGDRARRRVHADPEQHHARGPRRHDPHHRPPGDRLQAHPPPPPALQNRRRRPDQPPQTRLRPGPITPQRRHRPPDLGRLGGAQLQHRHLHHPPMTPEHPKPGERNPGPETREAKTRTEPRPRLARHHDRHPLTAPPGLSGGK
jgi:IS5 family transposase